MTPASAAAASLVSVVMPTRNRAVLLPRAIDSVFAQTHRALELIVVNDASTDDTRAVLARYDDPRLRVIHRDANSGAAAARNAAIAVARGELIAFLDDDDFWLVQKLEKQVAAMAAAGPDVGWSVTGHLRLAPRCAAVGGAFYEHQLDYRRGLGPEGPDWSLIATPGWMVRREVLVGVGAFDERIRSWDDWELGLRLSQATRRILVDEPLWVQDWLRGTGLIHQERARARDLRLIIERHGALWAGQPRVVARHWRVIGRAESLYDPAPAGRDALLRSVRAWPFDPKAWAALAVSFLGLDNVQRLTRQVRRLKARFV
jgi:glycosyltransferase involved in cell wall biosynthesis